MPEGKKGQRFYCLMDVGGRLWDSLSNQDKMEIMKKNWQRAYDAKRAGCMTPAQLAEIATRLYGPRWQAALARDIARPKETVNRWARGRSPIPLAVQKWLRRKDGQGN